MKTLLYVTREYCNINSGVWKKIIAQCQGISENNCKVYLLYATVEGAQCDYFDENGQHYYSKSNIHTTVSTKGIGRLLWHAKFANIIYKLTTEIVPDGIYIRTIYPLTPALLYQLWKIRNAKKTKIIWEIPTYPYRQEYWGNKNYSYYLFDILCFKLLVKVVNYLVVIADEYPRNLPQGKVIEMSNGIRYQSISPSRRSMRNEGEIHLVGIAYYSYWHGYDRLLEGLGEYYSVSSGNRLKVYIHFVGENMNELEDITKRLYLQDYVTFHGPLHGQKLDELFNSMDIGIASLGMHRKNFTKTSELKIREFIARGVPYIASCEDLDIPSDFIYNKIFSNNEQPISIIEIINFINVLPDNNTYQKYLREFAKEKLDWRIKMKEVIDIL